MKVFQMLWRVHGSPVTGLRTEHRPSFQPGIRPYPKVHAGRYPLSLQEVLSLAGRRQIQSGESKGLKVEGGWELLVLLGPEPVAMLQSQIPNSSIVSHTSNMSQDDIGNFSSPCSRSEAGCLQHGDRGEGGGKAWTTLGDSKQVLGR